MSKLVATVFSLLYLFTLISFVSAQQQQCISSTNCLGNGDKIYDPYTRTIYHYSCVQGVCQRSTDFTNADCLPPSYTCSVNQYCDTTNYTCKTVGATTSTTYPITSGQSPYQVPIVQTGGQKLTIDTTSAAIIILLLALVGFISYKMGQMSVKQKR